MPYLLSLPSDIGVRLTDTGRPLPLMEYPSSSHEDLRMQEIKRKIDFVRGKIEYMYRYLRRIERPHRKEAREALRKAFEAGYAYGELKQIPVEPPFLGPDGKFVLGKELKEHILATREVYAEISQLRELTGNLLSEEAEYLLTPITRREQDQESGASATNIAA